MTDENKKTQVGIILVSHADYGTAMLRTAEFILGQQSDCSSISVDVAHEVSETVRRLTDATQRLDKGAGVIILTDMFGGTPTNLALALLATHKVRMRWLKGHAGHPENERCDVLARAEAGRKDLPPDTGYKP